MRYLKILLALIFLLALPAQSYAEKEAQVLLEDTARGTSYPNSPTEDAFKVCAKEYSTDYSFSSIVTNISGTSVSLDAYIEYQVDETHWVKLEGSDFTQVTDVTVGSPVVQVHHVDSAKKHLEHFRCFRVVVNLGGGNSTWDIKYRVHFDNRGDERQS